MESYDGNTSGIKNDQIDVPLTTRKQMTHDVDVHEKTEKKAEFLSLSSHVDIVFIN